MEVCYQLPVLPLDRPVPKHVLSRRGAISLSSSSALFGGPVPRQLSKRRGAISYDSLDQTALYIRLLDVRVRVQSGCDAETEERPRPYTHPCPNLRLLHAQHESQRARRRALSFQRHFHSSRCLQGKRGQIPLHLLDSEHSMQAKAMLKRVGSWNFNIFKFDRLTNGNSLIDLTFHLFNKYGLMELFQLDMLRLLHFLVLVQEDYHSQNPYHNSSHAADVTQAMYCYLQEPKLSESLTSCDILLGLLAAATHDLDHPGVNQAFLIKTDHHLAALYRNSSVLENHHWRSAVSLLRETGLLSHLPTENRLSLEKRLGSLILATDITRQNAYMCDFRAYLDRTDLNMGKAEHRHFILQMALKCADICNPCRPWTLCKQWSEKVTEEFFYQGDIERKYGLDMSPFCDRTTYTVAQIQNSFMRFVVEPLFVEWARFSDTQLSRTMLGHLTLNKARWSRQTQEGVRNTSSASPSARLPHGGQGS